MVAIAHFAVLASRGNANSFDVVKRVIKHPHSLFVITLATVNCGPKLATA